MDRIRRTKCRGGLALVLGMALVSGAEAEAVAPLGMVEVRVAVELSCPSCAQGLERRLGRLDHVARVEIQSNEGQIVLAPEHGEVLDLGEVRHVIRNAGFLPTGIWLAAVGRVTHVDGVPVLALSGDGAITLAAGDQTDQLVAAAADGIVRGMGRILDPKGRGDAEFLYVTAFEPL